MKKLTYLLITFLVVFALATPSLAATKEFAADLSGANEVPPRVTDASGSATFKIGHRNDALTMSYILRVTNIQNVVAAHIHCAPAGTNGPVGVTLYMAAPGGGRISGVIASGEITAPDPGNSCGWITLDDVISAIRMDNAYVNVHTNDGVDPANTGPGDFPGGEIRGQIQ